MDVFNKLTCANPTANTGISDCALDIKALAGGFSVPSNFEIPAASAGTVEAALAYLQAAAESDVSAERIFPLPGVFNFTDNSEDPTYQTGSTGVQTFVRDGKYDWTIQFTQGGYCLLQEIQKLNGSNRKLLFFDEAGVLYGTRGKNGGLAGIPLNVFRAMPWKANDGSNITIYAYRVNFNAAYVNTGGLTFIPFNFSDISSITGLLNVSLSQLAPRVAANVQVGANVSCGGQDLYELYSTELQTIDAWVVTKNGKNVDLSGVALNANLGGWTVVLDTTDPDYGATGDIVINLAAPSALKAAGVVGYAGIPKVITTT